MFATTGVASSCTSRAPLLNSSPQGLKPLCSRGTSTVHPGKGGSLGKVLVEGSLAGFLLASALGEEPLLRPLGRRRGPGFHTFAAATGCGLRGLHAAAATSLPLTVLLGARGPARVALSDHDLLSTVCNKSRLEVVRSERGGAEDASSVHNSASRRAKQRSGRFGGSDFFNGKFGESVDQPISSPPDSGEPSAVRASPFSNSS